MTYKNNKMQSISRNLFAVGVLSGLAACGGGDDSLPTIPQIVANSAPQFSSQAVTSIQADSEFSYSISVSDPDVTDTLTITATTLPDWLTFDIDTNMISGLPDETHVGEHTIIVTVSDGNISTTQEFTLTVTAPPAKWILVWSDEFDGSTINSDNWNIETGDGSQYGISGWGNNELEWYQEENITLADGNLVITAKEQQSNGYNFTSGRMRSDNKVDVTFGRIEASIKVPLGQGLWSAFWMLPTDSQYGGWASGGEIDIMELLNVSNEAENELHANIHYGMAWPLNQNVGDKTQVQNLDEFHLYAIEWDKNEIRWYIDDLHYASITADTWWSYYYDESKGYVSVPEGPFNKDFHLLFNLAVGGNWPGSPNAETVFPAEMVVDYVRVYECDALPDSGDKCGNNISSAVKIHDPASVYTTAYNLFSSGEDSLTWQVGDEPVSRALQAQVAWDNNGAISLSTVDIGGENGAVLDINTSNMGNIAINAVDGNKFNLYGMGNSAQSWELHAGELKFDLYIDSANTTADSQITVKMDSGWPKVGSKALNVADLPKDQWTSVSVKVNDLIATPGEQPLDTASVMNVFVMEFSAEAHVQIDNIQLKCGHPTQNGCGIKAPAAVIELDTMSVFSDTPNTDVWNKGIGAWDNATNADYFQGDTANHVTWNVVDEADRGQVLEVNFSDGDESGLLYIQSSQAVNLQNFSAGSLVFDLKVSDYGSSTQGMSYKVDCIYPCSTGDTLLGVVADREWETITIPVSQLVKAGLDLSSVNTGLVIFPTWGDQKGVSFQLDNVRWESTYEAPAPDAPVSNTSGFSIYNDAVATNWSFWDCCGGATIEEVVDSESDKGNVMQVTFMGQPTVAGAQAETHVDISGISNATLEFDLKMVSAPTNDAAQWLLKVESATASNFAEVSLMSSSEGAAPTLGEWQHYTFNVSDLASQGLDISELKLILVFPTWAQASGAVYQIDNLLIKEN